MMISGCKIRMAMGLGLEKGIRLGWVVFYVRLALGRKFVLGLGHGAVAEYDARKGYETGAENEAWAVKGMKLELGIGLGLGLVDKARR